MSNIAFLGTGLLGGALAEAAARRGDQVVAWNRTAAKAHALEASGVRVAASPAEAVRGAERVHLVLTDDDAVESVIAQFRPGLHPSTIVCDHTTTQPARTAARAAALNADGVRYLHCPVFIGPAAAREGKGTIMSSGPRALFDAVQPGLARMAERVEWFGERADLAAIAKLSGNAFIIGIAALVADVFAMAKGAGVPPASTLRVVDLFNPVAAITNRGKRMAEAEFDPSFELAMARKDVRLMLETAGDGALAALPGIGARMDALIAAGYGDRDFGILAVESVS